MARGKIILITNDDGIDAAGIKALERGLGRLAEVHVYAPDRERSAVSHSISLGSPLRVKAAGPRRFALDGTPTDCVYMAVNYLMKSKPDIVVSGINPGPNLGDDVTYSGTVAAAMEAAMQGISAFAVSIVNGGEHGFRVAARLIRSLAERILTAGLPQGVFLNVNVPFLDGRPPSGFRMTRTGRRRYFNSVVEQKDPRGRTVFWIGGGDNYEDEDIPDSDCNAVKENVISVTPMTANPTDFSSFARLGGLKAAGYVRLDEKPAER